MLLPHWHGISSGKVLWFSHLRDEEMDAQNMEIPCLDPWSEDPSTKPKATFAQAPFSEPCPSHRDECLHHEEPETQVS